MSASCLSAREQANEKRGVGIVSKCLIYRVEAEALTASGGLARLGRGCNPRHPNCFSPGVGVVACTKSYIRAAAPKAPFRNNHLHHWSDLPVLSIIFVTTALKSAYLRMQYVQTNIAPQYWGQLKI